MSTCTCCRFWPWLFSVAVICRIFVVVKSPAFGQGRIQPTVFFFGGGANLGYESRPSIKKVVEWGCYPSKIMTIALRRLRPFRCKFSSVLGGVAKRSLPPPLDRLGGACWRWPPWIRLCVRTVHSPVNVHHAWPFTPRNGRSGSRQR